MRTLKTEEIFGKKILIFIFFFTLIAIIVAGLWPFRFSLKNEVEWLKNETGIRFSGRGFVSSQENNFFKFPPLQGPHPLTIELFVRPTIEPNRNLPVLLSIYEPINLGAIYIAQWKSSLIIRWMNLKSPLLFREFGVGNVLAAGERKLLTIICDPSGTSIFVDAKLQRQNSLNPFSPLQDNSACFVLGNSPGGGSSWSGDLFGVAFYNRSLSPSEISINHERWLRKRQPEVSPANGLVSLFLFEEKSGLTIRDQVNPEIFLTMPEHFQPLYKEVLSLPWREFRWKSYYLLDMAVNLFGFIPFGFFLFGWINKNSKISLRKSFFLTILIGTAISSSIELIQVWIPLRSSQSMDVIMNSFGTSIGIMLSAAVLRARASAANW